MRHTVSLRAAQISKRVATPVSNITASSLSCSNADLATWMSTERDTVGISKAELNRTRNQFYNAGQKRCTLCDEYFESSFAGHCGYVGHMARMGIIERVVSLLQDASQLSSSTSSKSSIVTDRTKLLVEEWWSRLNKSEMNELLDFRRIPSLSAPKRNLRVWRVRFLLEFLRDREVIRDSLSSGKLNTITGENAFVRTRRFERSEMIGDNIVKSIVADRLLRLFPSSEGGVTYKLACIQQLLDSNEGLLQIYDYLDLNNIIGARLPNNKSKSDVVESLFGELQTFIWASEVEGGLNQYPAIPTAEHRYVRALVDHLLNELTHVIIMWRLETTLENAKDFLEEHIQRKSIRHKSSGVVKEEECDRARYAVLPLMLSFSRSNGNLNSGPQRHAEGRPAPPTRIAPPMLVVKGTPLMLLFQPTPKPQVMESRYTPLLRVVRSTAEYRSMVIASLLSHKTSEVHCAGAAPGSLMQRGDFAAERYPSWDRDRRLAVIRQKLHSQLEESRIFTGDKIEWHKLLDTAADHVETPPKIPNCLALHERAKQLRALDVATRPAMPLCVDNGYIPPLAPTMS